MKYMLVILAILGAAVTARGDGAFPSVATLDETNIVAFAKEVIVPEPGSALLNQVYRVDESRGQNQCRRNQFLEMPNGDQLATLSPDAKPQPPQKN